MDAFVAQLASGWQELLTISALSERRALRSSMKTIPLHVRGGVMKRDAWVLVAVVLAGCQQRVISVADDQPTDRSPDAGAVDASEPRPDADFQVRWADAAVQPTSTGADAGAPNC